MTEQSKPDLRISHLEHRAMRADAARLTNLVGTAQPDDATALTALPRWYTGYQGAIRDHHRVEDVIIYPALRDRDPYFMDAEDDLEGEHRVLADRLASPGRA